MKTKKNYKFIKSLRSLSKKMIGGSLDNETLSALDTARKGLVSHKVELQEEINAVNETINSIENIMDKLETKKEKVIPVNLNNENNVNNVNPTSINISEETNPKLTEPEVTMKDELTEPEVNDESNEVNDESNEEPNEPNEVNDVNDESNEANEELEETLERETNQESIDELSSQAGGGRRKIRTMKKTRRYKKL